MALAIMCSSTSALYVLFGFAYIHGLAQARSHLNLKIAVPTVSCHQIQAMFAYNIFIFKWKALTAIYSC